MDPRFSVFLVPAGCWNCFSESGVFWGLVNTEFVQEILVQQLVLHLEIISLLCTWGDSLQGLCETRSGDPLGCSDAIEEGFILTVVDWQIEVFSFPTREPSLRKTAPASSSWWDAATCTWRNQNSHLAVVVPALLPGIWEALPSLGPLCGCLGGNWWWCKCVRLFLWRRENL